MRVINISMFKQEEAEAMTKYLYTVTGVISSIVGLGAFLFLQRKEELCK